MAAMTHAGCASGDFRTTKLQSPTTTSIDHQHVQDPSSSAHLPASLLHHTTV